MGQAKRRGTYEQRVATATMYAIEAEAWALYYRKEEERYRQWLFNHMSAGDKVRTLNRELANRRVERILHSYIGFGLAMSSTGGWRQL